MKADYTFLKYWIILFYLVDKLNFFTEEVMENNSYKTRKVFKDYVLFT